MAAQIGIVETLPTEEVDGVIKIEDTEESVSFTVKTKGADGLSMGDKVGFVNKGGKATVIRTVDDAPSRKNDTDTGSRAEALTDGIETAGRTRLHKKIGKVTVDVDIQNISKRNLTAVLALTLGGLGMHKFLLGLKKEGYIMLAAFFLGVFLFMIPTFAVIVLALAEGVKYLTMKDEAFNETYLENKKAWF